MRVALVNPPQVDLVDPNVYPPTGLVCLRGAARKWAPWARCDLINAAGDQRKLALRKIVKGKYDAVGFGATSTYWNATVDLASSVKHVAPRTHLFVGGPHPTTTGETAECFDTTFVGPADKSFVAFLRDLRDGKPRELYQPISTDLDDLPFLYHVRGKAINTGGNDKTAIVYTSRGCTHNCCFCAARGMYQKMQYRSIDNVAAEFRSIRKRGFGEIRFMDDTITADPERLKKLCEVIRPFGFRWGCTARTDQVLTIPNLLDDMKASGCTEVGFGSESFDDAVLTAIGKSVTAKQNREAIVRANEAGLRVHVFMMISTPGETTDTVNRNIDALEGLYDRFHRLLLSTMMPYPGSRLYANPAKFGCLLLDRDATRYNQHQYVHDGEARIWSPLKIIGLSREQQLDNIRLMRQHTGRFRQVNRGVFKKEAVGA